MARNRTGHDEPLQHTMYVDKTPSGIKAIQRPNRVHPQKRDTFALDLANDAERNFPGASARPALD